jgi:TPR repeat protein
MDTLQPSSGFGWCELEDDYWADTVRWWRKAAEQGHANAQDNLGLAYANGEGVPQDYTEAARWYRKAADQGYARAQYNLGCSYTFGQGVVQDYVEAAKWYRKSADQGDARGQYNLGVMYDNGDGVAQDNVQAHIWMNLAAAHAGPDDGKKYAAARDRVAARMNPAQIAEAQRLARGWRPSPQ